MLPFENFWDASTIKGQVGGILINARLTRLTLVMTVRERPPGETLAPPQEVDRCIGGKTIQPGLKVVVVVQVMPQNMGTQKHLLRDVIGILPAAEQAVDVGVYWPFEPLIHGPEIRRMCITRKRSRCLSTLRLGCFFHYHILARAVYL